MGDVGDGQVPKKSTGDFLIVMTPCPHQTTVNKTMEKSKTKGDSPPVSREAMAFSTVMRLILPTDMYCQGPGQCMQTKKSMTLAKKTRYNIGKKVSKEKR